MDVLVTGGTGRLGRRLADPLQAAGHRVKLMSRRGTGPGGIRGDLASGRDLHQALAGAEVVVHAATDPRGDYWQTDVAGTRRLVQAVDRDRLQHLVYVSIVGVDRIPYGYYRAKFAAEQVLLASGLPVTLLRITQFHDSVDDLLQTARRGPVLPVPMGWRARPVDVGEAAAYVSSVASGPPSRDDRRVRRPGGARGRGHGARVGRGPRAGRAGGGHAAARPAEHRVPRRRGAALRRRPGTSHVRRAPARLTPVTGARTIDLRRELRDCYSAGRSPALVQVPELSFLMVDGHGDPDTSASYAEAVRALYATAYAVRFALKRGPQAIDAPVMPLEGLWWAPDMSAFTAGDRAAWNWTMMIALPDVVGADVVDGRPRDRRAQGRAGRGEPGAPGELRRGLGRAGPARRAVPHRGTDDPRAARVHRGAGFGVDR